MVDSLGMPLDPLLALDLTLAHAVEWHLQAGVQFRGDLQMSMHTESTITRSTGPLLRRCRERRPGSARDAPGGLEPVGVPKRGRRRGWGVGETGVLTSQ